MTQASAPTHDPIPIGEIAKPPFARLPDPLAMFARRAARLKVLANNHQLGSYLLFLGNLSEAQHRIQDGLPAAELPPLGTIERAREFRMPPLDRIRFVPDKAMDATWERLMALAAAVAMPDNARIALDRVSTADPVGKATMLGAVLSNAIPSEELAEHAFVAAALQVHFVRLAAQLDAKALVPVGEGACPACGGAPVSSMVVGWPGAQDTRFCVCSLCGTLWNQPRVKCTLCGSTKGITYQEIGGGPATVKAETCESCGSYLKIMHQRIDAAIDPVADDVATLALDLLVRESGYRRGAVNPFLLGY
jgi:FdhE protein